MTFNEDRRLPKRPGLGGGGRTDPGGDVLLMKENILCERGEACSACEAGGRPSSTGFPSGKKDQKVHAPSRTTAQATGGQRKVRSHPTVRERNAGEPSPLFGTLGESGRVKG